MTRKEEYMALLEELEQSPAELEGTVKRALKRRRASQKKRCVFGIPAGSLAACFLGFMLLVNLFPPFARACGNVPVLRELAKAVAWSPSLSAAVENEYVQPIGQSQSANGITATVEYVIVDRKQLRVYYTLASREYPQLEADADLQMPDAGWGGGSSSYGTPNGELREVHIDFIDEDVPETLKLLVKVYAGHKAGEAAAPSTQVGEGDPFGDEGGNEPDYLAEFTFQLEFDPYFTAQGEIIPVDTQFTLDGQTFTLTEVEIYPTHLRVDLKAGDENTAWLERLHLYLENEHGERFETVTNGITAVGEPDGEGVGTLWLDSTFFSYGKHLTLYITGAKWRDKDAARVRLNLPAVTAENLPEGIRFLNAEKYAGGWVVSFIAPLEGENGMYSVFQNAWDEDGRSCDGAWETCTYGYTDPATGEHVELEGHFTFEMPLPGLRGDTAYLEPWFNRATDFDTPIAIPIK